MLLERVAPSVVLPGILTPQVQNVNFEKYIGKKTNFGDIKNEMLYIVTANNINSEVSVGQQWNHELNRQSYSLGQTALPFYRINAYVEWDLNEEEKFKALSNGVALPNFLENLAKQGINQKKHQGILYGFDPQLNQGILSNVTIHNMPADSKSKTKLLEYDIMELQTFLAGIARSVMDASFGMAKPVVFASSVRVINYIRTAIIPVANYVDKGSVATVGQVYDRVVSEWLGVGKVEFVADELLKGKTKDTILLIAPGMDNQESVPEDLNQNLVGEENSIKFNTMYDAGEGLRKMIRPEDAGIFSEVLTYKMTPGANLRKEAVCKVEVQYS